MTNNEKILVQIAKPVRKFIKIYFDFLYSKLLTGDEKFVFIILKSFIDFSTDDQGTQGDVFPTIQTICDISGYGEKKVTRILKNLKTKRIIKITRRGLTKSNVYTLSDYETMWKCDNLKDLAMVVENGGMKPLTVEEHIAELERMGYRVEIKKDGLESTVPAKVTVNPSTKANNLINKSITDEKKCQVERYTLDQIRQLFDYSIMIHDNPYQKQDIDSIMDILHTVMNTTKPTIRVAGEDRPAMVVIGKLMKLHKDSIMYAIKKFSEQTERIKNPTSYMLTILYFAPEQFNLDIQNQVRYDMKHWNEHE